MQYRYPRLWGLLTLILLCACPAHAQLTLTLFPSLVSARPGETIGFTALLENFSGETVDLLGGTGTINGPDNTALFWDDSDLLSALPGSLEPAEQFQTDIFLLVAGAAPDGLYMADYSIDAIGQSSNQFTSAVSSVSVTVALVAPEPPTANLIVFMVGGMLVTAGLARSRRKVGCV